VRKVRKIKRAKTGARKRREKEREREREREKRGLVNVCVCVNCGSHTASFYCEKPNLENIFGALASSYSLF
jgi:hypothetical protein